MIGRRQFLELLSGLVGQSFLDGGPSRFVKDERFVSVDLGLTFCKPSGWIFIAPEQLAREAEDIGRARGRSALSPSVMNISKEPWGGTPKRFTPGINVWSYDDSRFDSLDSMVDATLCSHGFYQDFRVTADPKPTTIGGCASFDFVTEFTFDTVGIDRPTDVRDRFICIRHGRRFLQIALCDSPSTGKAEDAAFKSFLSSLVIAEPTQNVEQGSAGQPATRSESDPEGGDKPQPESEVRSR
ncbi:hypothetical protein [Luteolibacter marinus]|uniref:hypothetical protein n=1 Tax=Luteolibacter marinus TaxID=2776705 RepID=UPI001867B7FA|nr:hypothetical protein [Luteolibacter marinus]